MVLFFLSIPLMVTAVAVAALPLMIMSWKEDKQKTAGRTIVQARMDQAGIEPVGRLEASGNEELDAAA